MAYEDEDESQPNTPHVGDSHFTANRNEIEFEVHSKMGFWPVREAAKRAAVALSKFPFVACTI
jgi:hypothetical protein